MPLQVKACYLAYVLDVKGPYAAEDNSSDDGEQQEQQTAQYAAQHGPGVAVHHNMILWRASL